jgi:hypothetical protein
MVPCREEPWPAAMLVFPNRAYDIEPMLNFEDVMAGTSRLTSIGALAPDAGATPTLTQVC